MKISNVPRRISGILSYAGLAQSAADYPRLAALGVARHHPFTSRDFLGRLGHRLYPRISFRVAQFGGMWVCLDPSDRDQMIIFEEIAMPPFAYDFQLPFRPDAIFDCGGHIGLFCITAAHAYPGVPIMTFEPNPRNLCYLRRNIRLNRLKVTVIRAAVSTADGEDWFVTGRSPEGHLSSSPPPVRNINDDDPVDGGAPTRYRVAVIDFPRFFKAQNAKSPLVKIDIEGEELKLIPALVDLLPTPSAVYFETHHGEPAWNTISTLFRSRGFTVTRRRHWLHCVNGLAVRQ